MRSVLPACCAKAGVAIYLTVGEREWARLRDGVVSFSETSPLVFP